MGDVYEELLAAVDRRVLRAPCDALMERHLALARQHVEDAHAALQRLQDVTRAAQKLRRAPLDVDHQQQLKTLSARLRRKTVKALKRMRRRMMQPAGEGEDSGDGRGDNALHAADVGAVNDDVSEVEQTHEQALAAPEARLKDLTVHAEPASHMDPHRDTVVEPSARCSAKTLPTDGNKSDKVKAEPEKDLCVSFFVTRTTTLPDAVAKLTNDPANRDLLQLVQSYMRIADDFRSRPVADQVAMVQAYAMGTKAAVSIFATKYAAQATHEQRLMLGFVFTQAIDVVVSFVTEKACESVFETTILLSVLDCIALIQASESDCAPSDLERLKQRENDLVGYLQEQNAPALHDWEVKKRQTVNRRRDFRNMRGTLENWIHNKRCRGSALDQTMDRFEQLLAASLQLWDVANDETVTACVQHMTAIASKVDGSSVDKVATRTQKLNAFRSLLNGEAS